MGILYLIEQAFNAQFVFSIPFISLIYIKLSLVKI